MKRVGIIGLEHETNTFRPALTPLAEFTIKRGDELLAERGRRTYAGGMFDGIDAIGAVAIPLVLAGAQPSGAIAAACSARLRPPVLRPAAMAAAAPGPGRHPQCGPHHSTAIGRRPAGACRRGRPAVRRAG